MRTADIPVRPWVADKDVRGTTRHLHLDKTAEILGRKKGKNVFPENSAAQGRKRIVMSGSANRDVCTPGRMLTERRPPL